MNAQLKNTVPNARNRSEVLNARVGPIRTAGLASQTVTFGGVGYLIGMLGMTYTKNFTVTNILSGANGPGPNIRISNT